MRPTSSPLIRALLSLLALAPLAACAPEPAREAEPSLPAQTAAGAHGDGIAWFAGTTEEAFAAAAAQGRPLFLYWGAEWCPPCHYLKDKIFRQPEFVAKSRAFIAVYLDGDTERAQIWGEKFGTVGYPTVIIFDPQGREALRMTSGIPVEEYTGVLDKALGRMQPIREVLAAVLAAGPGEASSTDLNLLAFHSWDDGKAGLPPAERWVTFRRLYEQAPAELAVEKSRFLTLLLGEMAHRTEGEENASSEPALSDEDRAAYHAAVLDLLGRRELRNANLFFVFYAAADTVRLLHPEPSPEGAALVGAWEAAARACEADEELSMSDRLYALKPQIDLARLAAGAPPDGDEPPPIGGPLAGHIRERIAWASREVTDESLLQNVLNTAANVLAGAGLLGDAEALIAERMNDTAAPYYFMSWLGEIESKQGHSAEAVAWFRQAYDSARGPNTRFQWGAEYLHELMDLKPEDAAAVEAASREVLGELLAHDDAFANRNLTRVQGLEDTYREWGTTGERRAAVGRIRAFVRASCERLADDGEDSPRDRCVAFLANDAPAES